MSYRDDKDALLARNDALERDLADREEELEEARAALATLRAERAESADGPQQRSRQPAAAKAPSNSASKLRYLAFAVPAALLIYLAFTGARACVASRPATAADPATLIADICSIDRDRPLVLVDEVDKARPLSSDNESPERYYFLSIIDPVTGKRLVRRELGQRRRHCLGFQGDVVWLRDPTGKFEARSLHTGEVAISSEQLATVMPVPIKQMFFDERAGAARATGADGRQYYVDTSAALSVSERIPADATPATPSQTSQPWVAPGPRRRIIDSEETAHRAFVTVNDERIGQRDFLEPRFVVSQVTKSWLWPSPESVMVQEPTELGSKIYRLTRLALDGGVLWEYEPSGASSEDQWIPRPEGDLLWYFKTDASVLAIDAQTGETLYELRL